MPRPPPRVPGALTPLVPFADGVKRSPFENAIQLSSSQADPDVKISAVTSAMGGSAWDDGWHRPRRWVAVGSAMGGSDSDDRWQCDRRWVTPRAAMGGSASRDGWQRDRRWVSVTSAIGDSAIGDRWPHHPGAASGGAEISCVRRLGSRRRQRRPFVARSPSPVMPAMSSLVMSPATTCLAASARMVARGWSPHQTRSRNDNDSKGTC